MTKFLIVGFFVAVLGNFGYAETINKTNGAKTDELFIEENGHDTSSFSDYLFNKTVEPEQCDENNQLDCIKKSHVIYQCNPLDPLACNTRLREVCAFIGTTYQCQCPINYSRDQSGKCSVINECMEPGLNDCHPNAICTDTLDSYNCTCRPGFIDFSANDQSGRICKLDIDECKDPVKYEVDCDADAVCKNTLLSYTCECKLDFYDVSEKYNLLQGRKCQKKTDPCSSKSTNDCSVNAKCISDKGFYTCQCRDGFEDVSPNKFYPGRDCRPQDVALPKDTICSSMSSLANDSNYHCLCDHDCDQNAECIQKPGSFDCRCKLGFFDNSTQPDVKPGRVCVKEEDKCSDPDENDCSVFARCTPYKSTFKCQCQDGYLDVSSQYGQLPGRNCIKEKNECTDPTMNSCDQNANCIKKPSGYACLCSDGYHDVSSSAHLKPGRVCTLVTNCPSQPTDLVFLIDGSFSIGEKMFKTEVLRFLAEFVALFTISSEDTRVSVIQFSHYVRKEISFNQYSNLTELQNAILNIEYLRGMTRTGVAIDYVLKEGYKLANGARSEDKSVRKNVVVITDGMAQDNIREPSARAQRQGLTMFSVGVGDFIGLRQLRVIAGGKQEHVFIVGAFTELNTKLRAIMQKKLCPEEEAQKDPNQCPKCDAVKNFICQNGTCVCPEGFCLDPVTGACGGRDCNPELGATSCVYPMVCKKTPYNVFRCACPATHFCQNKSGACISNATVLEDCPANLTRNPRTQKCEGCSPACDATKNQICKESTISGEFKCDCPDKYSLDSSTQICTINECEIPGLHNCSQFAKCIDTMDGFFCNCLPGYTDRSVGPHSGISCFKPENLCLNKRHDCSPYAECIPDLEGRYTCKCKNNYIDMYPLLPGRICEHRENECLDASKNNCSLNAECKDLNVGYTCFCKFGFQDVGPANYPGRICMADPCQNPKLNTCWKNRCRVLNITDGKFACEPCPEGYYDVHPDNPGHSCKPKLKPCANATLNDCDNNAFCSSDRGSYDKFTCRCRDGFVDLSPNPLFKPGRKCVKIFNPCLNSTLNDCDPHAICLDLKNNSYSCLCKPGYLDRSSDKQKLGRDCLKLINECARHDLNNCSVHAHCTDKIEGYNCECRPGYKDESKNNLTGRICTEIPDPCSSTNLNDCDPRAQCTRLNYEEYNCSCNKPYIDNSTDSNKPGRICIYDGCGFNETNLCDPNALCFNGNGFVQCKCKEDYIDPDPHRPGLKCIPEPLCGTKPCKAYYGLVCDQEKSICKCKEGWRRKTDNVPCIKARPIRLYLWVSRYDEDYYIYNDTFENLTDPSTKAFSDLFIQGIDKVAARTNLWNYYFDAKIQTIENPVFRNVHWNKGLWVEYTINVNGSGWPLDSYSSWQLMVDTIKDTFNYSVGATPLFIDEFQQPYACYKNDCDEKAQCVQTAIAAYVCVCPNDTLDISPTFPGRKCAADPCKNLSHNCDLETSVCVTYPNATYTCDCKSGYIKNETDDKCHLNFCLDFPDCVKLNGTCYNVDDGAKCICNHGYVALKEYDLRRRIQCHGDSICLKPQDVDYCCLQDHACDWSAQCKLNQAPTNNNNTYYKCLCDDGREVPSGTSCISKMKRRQAMKQVAAWDDQYSCESCINSGRCNQKCQCTTWYSGQDCWLDLRFIIGIFLVLLIFLVLIVLALFSLLKRHYGSRNMAQALSHTNLSQFTDSSCAASCISPSLTKFDHKVLENPVGSSTTRNDAQTRIIADGQLMSKFLDGSSLDSWDEKIFEDEMHNASTPKRF